MISGMFESAICAIWSLRRSLRFFRRASSSWVELGSAESAAISSSRRRCSALSAARSGTGWSSLIATALVTASARGAERAMMDRSVGEPRLGPRQNRRIVVYYAAVTLLERNGTNEQGASRGIGIKARRGSRANRRRRAPGPSRRRPSPPTQEREAEIEGRDGGPLHPPLSPS